MPKLTIKKLQDDLKTIRELRQMDTDILERRRVEIDHLKKRVSDIAAENESLRMDKKWLQSIISSLAQAIHTRS